MGCCRFKDDYDKNNYNDNYILNNQLNKTYIQHCFIKEIYGLHKYTNTETHKSLDISYFKLNRRKKPEYYNGMYFKLKYRIKMLVCFSS